MSAVKNFLDRLGGTFLVSAMVPTLAFVSFCLLAFEPILPEPMHQALALGENFDPVGRTGIIALIITIVIGFTLTSLSTFNLKVFEGYVLIQRLKFLRRGELKKYRRMKAKLDQIDRRIKQLNTQRGPNIKRMRSSLEDKKYSLSVELQERFPSREADILPTSFGNILKAAEYYPRLRYQIDSVPIWTRLVHVIPPAYEAKIDQSYNQLVFLVNCSLLCLAFTGMAFFASFYQFILLQAKLQVNSPAWIPYFIRDNLTETTPLIFEQRVWLYGIVAVMALFMSLVFQRAALLSVGEFGDTIRSSYDLFRFDLLRQLHLPLPVNSNVEQTQWYRLSNFFNLGHDKYSKPLEYQHPTSVRAGKLFQEETSEG